MHEEKTFKSNIPVVKILERTPSDKITTEVYIYYDYKKECYNVIGRKNTIGDFKYRFDSKKILRNFVKLILDDDYSSSITLHNYVLFKKFKNLTLGFFRKYERENELAGYNNAELFKNVNKYFKNFIKMAKEITISSRQIK